MIGEDVPLAVPILSVSVSGHLLAPLNTWRHTMLESTILCGSSGEPKSESEHTMFDDISIHSRNKASTKRLCGLIFPNENGWLSGGSDEPRDESERSGV